MPIDAAVSNTTRRPVIEVEARGRRRPWLIAAGFLLSAVGALAVTWLVGAAGQRQEVLVVRQSVEYGEVIEAGDLGVARVSVDPGVGVIAAEQRDSLIGQVAATRLTPGMLLVAGAVEPGGEPGSGRVLVPIAVAAERMPAGGLRAGDRILAIDAEPPEGQPVGVGIPATVVRIGAMDVNGVTVVDVTVGPADGPELAIAAANGRVALVVQPMGS